MSPKPFLFGLLFACARANTFALSPRDDCNPCNPQGATGTNPPTFGPDLKSMYIDVLTSVKDIHFRKRHADRAYPRAEGFCCRASLDCVNVNSLNIPMCYDKFTTNFAFADGSYGSLTTGDYVQGGSKANLLSGQYTKDGGETGNIYAQDPAAKPNTATLSIPPQFTGMGEGTAIPASEIGSVVVITTEIGGTTLSTAPTTLPALTTLGTTISAHTVTAPTTISPVTAVMTTTMTGSVATMADSTKSAAASSATSQGAAVDAKGDFTRSIGMSLLSALMYLLL